MRLGDESHGLAPLLEHQGDGFALVGADAMGILDAVTEAPGAGRLALWRRC